MVLQRCIAVISPDGAVGPMTASLRTQLEDTTTGMASRGLRTLCITYRDFPAAQSARKSCSKFLDLPTVDKQLACLHLMSILARIHMRPYK